VHSFLLEMATAELADKLVYLNKIQFRQSALVMSRHRDYKGPRQTFLTHDEFLNHCKTKNKKRDASNTNSKNAKCAEYAMHPPSPTGVCGMEENRTSSNKQTNKSLTKEPKDKTRLETKKAEQSQTEVNNKGHSTLPKQELD